MTTNPPYQPPSQYGAQAPAQPGPPPPPAFAPQSGHPADPPRVTPPPPPGGPVAPVKAPPVAVLIPIAGLMAVIGAFLPWFTPELSGRGQTRAFENSLYSWKDGKIGLLPPIVLAVLSVSVIGLLMGKAARGRFSGSADPVKSIAKVSIGAGIGSVVCCVIAWFLVTSQFKFEDSELGGEISWSRAEQLAKANGLELGRGPQFGYFLTIAAGVVALIGGILMLVMSKNNKAAAPGFGQPGFGQPNQPGQPGQPGFGQPNQPNQPGFGQPNQQGYGQPGQNQPPSLYKPPAN